MNTKESRRARIRRQTDIRRMRLLRKENSRINRIWDQRIKDGTAVEIPTGSLIYDWINWHDTYGITT